MLRATLASIRAHKLRLVSTSVAIIIGVAFVTGTLILSDTLQGTFDDLFGQANAGIDVAVEGPAGDTDPFTGEDLHDPVPVELVDRLEAIDGVAAVSPEVSGFAQLIDEEGNPVGGFGPPTIGFSAPLSDRLETPELRDGRFPDAAGEIALDVATAEAEGIALGDDVPLVVDGPVETFKVVGTVGFGDLDSMAGATLVVFDPEEAFARYGDDGWSIVYLIADDGVAPEDLRDDVAAAIGDDYVVQTGAELSGSQAAEVGEGLGFFTTGLLVFAGVSLFVGAFLIANTFSIIVAQRTRELALLRAVGASRRQVLLTVMGEALATGLIGSLLGFAAGAALAQGLFALLDAFGIGLPQGDLVIEPQTFLIAVLLGTILTLVVALVPAIRGTAVPPVTALQAVAAPPPPKYGKLRYIAGGLVFAGGIAGLALSLQGGEIAVVGGAAVVTLLGASLLAPLVTRPLLRVLGAPVSAARGIQGQLASENALRNPRRTAATASALMIGLALVAFIQILATSFQTSANAAIDESFAGDFQIAPVGFAAPAGDPGADIEAQVREVDGVGTVATQRFGQAEVDGEDSFIAALDAESLAQVLALEYVEGDLDGFVEGGLAVSDDIAEDAGVSVGDEVTLTAGGETTTLTLGAITAANPVTGGWLVDADSAPDGLQFGGMFIALEDGADADAARADVEAVLEAYPTLQLQDLTEVKEQISSGIDQLLGLVTALLGLSVIVALFGIVNTLGLSVFERTRELGLLRAVGATRAQVRSMIRWESVLIAILGAVFGLVIGVLFAWLVITALSDEGVLQLTIPVVPLIGGMIAAAIAGVIAAIVPARRASRVDVLRALEAA